MEFERCNSSLKSHPFLAASAAKKKFTMRIRILQLVTSGGITIFRTLSLSCMYIIPKLRLSLIFGESNYTALVVVSRTLIICMRGYASSTLDIGMRGLRPRAFFLT